MSDEAVSQFVGVTGSSAEQARFFLDAANGNLETAIASFYEGGQAGGATGHGQDDEMIDDDSDEEEQQPAVATSQQQLPGGGYTLSGSAPAPSAAPVASSAASSRPASSAASSAAARGGSGPRIATLGSLNSGASSSSSSSSRPSGGLPRNTGPRIGRLHHSNDDDDGPGSLDNDKDPLEFFAGGGKSGLSVENPNAKKDDEDGSGQNSMIKGILQKAREGGSRLAGLSSGGQQQQGPSQTAFTGSAHTLGSDETPSTFIPAQQQQTASSRSRGGAVPGGFPGSAAAHDDDEDFDNPDDPPTVRNLTFWQDGFSIEDSDLYRYDDPANNEVLAALNSGRAPLSLLKVKHDERVELRIAQRMNEKWTRQPKPPAGPFAGEGNRLGSDLSSVDSSAPSVTSSSAATAPSTTNNRSAMGTAAVFEVDQTQPTTNLQIRLRDGQRLVARFNHSHTIADVRRYINNSSPTAGNFDYVLQTTFPSKDLTDDTQTLKEANLLGSVVVQRAL